MVIHFYLVFVVILSFSKSSHQNPVVNIQPYMTVIFKQIFQSVFSNPQLSSLCMICRIGVKTFTELLFLGVDDNTIANVIVDLCIDSNLATPRVCNGFVQEFKTEVFTVFKKVPLSSTELCDIWLGSSCPALSDTKLTWNVTFPDIPKPPVTITPSPKPSANQSRVLHLSDIHLDLLYRPGSNANCKEPLCCRDDFDVSANTSAGKWGDSRNCDTPIILLENMLEYISKTQQFDYVILTGDLPPHDVWNQTKADQLEVLKVVFNLLLKYFPKIPIYPSIGNHESNPVNSFPPPFIHENVSIDWLYDILAQTWTTWLPNSTLNTIKFGAYYSVLVQPKFRIISINMNYCNNLNLWLLLNLTDPADELTWLIKELQQAETNKEKVHIIGHIPPGLNDCLKTWSWNYYRIINRYESTITAQFFGHTHFDELELFYDEDNLKRPLSVAYIGPSVTPFTGLNPGFRIYTVDGNYPDSSRVVLDHETYIMNLTDANINGYPKWFKEYSAKEAYNMTSLLPHDWDDLKMRMESDDNLFNKYFKYYYKSLPPPTSCDKTCKKNILCAMISGRSRDPTMCDFLKR